MLGYPSPTDEIPYPSPAHIRYLTNNILLSIGLFIAQEYAGAVLAGVDYANDSWRHVWGYFNRFDVGHAPRQSTLKNDPKKLCLDVLLPLTSGCAAYLMMVDGMT